MPDPRQNDASDAAERPLENGSVAGSSGGDIGIEAAGPSQRNVGAMLMEKLSLQQQTDQDTPAHKQRYAFWETQPVAQFDEAGEKLGEGPIHRPKAVADVRAEPYNLPDSCEWCTCDMNDDSTIAEVFNLLTHNYVEDDDNMFRFNYSKAFLKWALQPPGAFPDWHIGVRVKTSGKLVAYITAVPATLRVHTRDLEIAEVNFLCVHKKLRSKRLAPVLIKEITRRVNAKGIWQAAYTAGVLLPKPVATCQYWHRSLNPKKLIGIGFSRLQPRMTMARTLKLYKLEEAPTTQGLRPLVAADVPQVTQLLALYLERFVVAPRFTEEEVLHYLLPVPDVIDAYVVQGPGGVITDLVSFYTLPSKVIGNAQYDSLKAAFMYYTVATKTPLPQLMTDALVLANKGGHDVFNALDILENSSYLKDLKFGIGDGKLRYYLYNWRIPRELAPSDVGLILL